MEEMTTYIESGNNASTTIALNILYTETSERKKERGRGGEERVVNV